MKVEAFYRKRKQLSQYLPVSERHKLKPERPPRQPNTGSAVNSPVRTVISNDNSLSESPITTSGNTTATGTTPTSHTGNAGKRRPSDPDSEADMSLGGGDNSTMSSISEVTNGEQAQPPMKRSNTANETPMNGNNYLLPSPLLLLPL